MAPVVPLARRRVRPTVFCRRCPGAGWIEDLVPRGGRCGDQWSRMIEMKQKSDPDKVFRLNQNINPG